MCDKNIIVNILEITSHMAHLRVKTLWKLVIQAKQYEKICDFKKKNCNFFGGRGGEKRWGCGKHWAGNYKSIKKMVTPNTTN